MRLYDYRDGKRWLIESLRTAVPGKGLLSTTEVEAWKDESASAYHGRAVKRGQGGGGETVNMKRGSE